MANKDVKVKVSADTKEAVRSLREMERQVDKLGDLADQGERRQDGFLSSRQVQMFKRILREMEGAYNTHNRKLTQMESEHSNKKNNKEIQKLRELEAELRKRQQLLRDATGGNRWGSEASPLVQEHHRVKYDQAQEALKAHQSSSELKKALSDVSQIEADLNVMRATVQRLQDERNRGQTHADRIGGMHEMDPGMRRYMHSAGAAIGGTGAIFGVNAWWNYAYQGGDLLRKQERATNSVALTGNFEGIPDQVDGELRRNNYKLGEAQYFDTYDTAIHQKAIISGGTTGDLKALNEDTKAVQRFGRAYDIDPNQIANGGAMLQRMGTLEEGQQQRFANMIAGAISKNDMGGRQEEMLRATVSLAQSVSQGQVQFTQQQFKNTMGLQVALGEAVPELKGERGANLLATMDGAIKGGGHQLDLLMGKGVEFTGLEGMTRLEELKEQGLSNPENLQRVLKGAKRMFGGNEDMTKWALKEQLGLQMNEYNALKESGFLDKIMEDPSSVSSKDLEGIGAKELSKQWNTYQNSETAQVDSMESQGRNLKGSHDQLFDEIAKWGRNTWHDMPDPLQHALLATGGVGLGGAMMWKGGAIRRGLINGASRLFRPTINGSGGAGATVGGWFNSARNAMPSGSSMMSGLKNFGSRTLEVAGNVGKRIPVAGALLGTGIDRVMNPENDWGRSLSKGIGGAIGGLLGGAGAVASGFFTGGLGWLGTGAAAVGGGVLGEKAGDWVYSLFAGDDDKKKKKVPTADSTSSSSSGAEAKLNTLNADKLNINSKDLASYFEKQSSKKDAETAGKSNKEQVVRVIVEGDIKGMDKKNQDKVADSVKDYFTTAFSYSNNPFKYNLALDQNRG